MFWSNWVRDGPPKLQKQNGGSLVILRPKIQRRLVFQKKNTKSLGVKRQTLD